MKTMCSSGYHQGDSVATNIFGTIMYGYTFLVPMKQEISTNKASSVIYVIISDPQYTKCSKVV